MWNSIYLQANLLTDNMKSLKDTTLYTAIRALNIEMHVQLNLLALELAAMGISVAWQSKQIHTNVQRDEAGYYIQEGITSGRRGFFFCKGSV